MCVSRAVTDLLKQQGNEVSSVEHTTASPPTGRRANGVSARMMRSRSGELEQQILILHMKSVPFLGGKLVNTKIVFTVILSVE